MIKLRHRQVLTFPPFAAAVVGVPHPAVVSHEHDLRVGWIDPHIMRVAVRSLKAAHRRKAFTRILAHNQRAIGLEHAVWIFWIDNQVREVKRAPYHPLAFVTLLPRQAGII